MDQQTVKAQNTTEKQRYVFELSLETPGNTHAIQFKLVPEHALVLDVGCHTGIMGQTLAARKGCTVIGIDQDLGALEIAATRLRDAFPIDLELAGWTKQVLARGHHDFDVILFGDVLEHTRRPEAVLREAQSLLKQQGRVIVSVPNVANLRVRLGLLRGRFEYEESGILDRTHMRFFTQDSARELIRTAGYRIIESNVTGYSLPHWLIRLFPGMLAVQFIFAATPEKDNGAVAEQQIG